MVSRALLSGCKELMSTWMMALSPSSHDSLTCLPSSSGVTLASYGKYLGTTWQNTVQKLKTRTKNSPRNGKHSAFNGIKSPLELHRKQATGCIVTVKRLPSSISTNQSVLWQNARLLAQEKHFARLGFEDFNPTHFRSSRGCQIFCLLQFFYGLVHFHRWGFATVLHSSIPRLFPGRFNCRSWPRLENAWQKVLVLPIMQFLQIIKPKLPTAPDTTTDHMCLAGKTSTTSKNNLVNKQIPHRRKMVC